jgi:hypothetical protein
VFFVLYAIRMFVFLNNLVMVLVSLPIYVKVAHFCFFIVLGVELLFCFAFVCKCLLLSMCTQSSLGNVA